MQRQVTELQDRVSALEASPGGTKCLVERSAVSQYDDYAEYWYGDAITGLDLDTPSSADWDVLVWTCGTQLVPQGLVPQPSEH